MLVVLSQITPNYTPCTVNHLKHSDLSALTSHLLYLFLLWFALFMWQARNVAIQTALLRFKKASCFIRCFLTLMKIRCTLSGSNAGRPQCSRAGDFCFLGTRWSHSRCQARCAWQPRWKPHRSGGSSTVPFLPQLQQTHQPAFLQSCSRHEPPLVRPDRVLWSPWEYFSTKHVFEKRNDSINLSVL